VTLKDLHNIAKEKNIPIEASFLKRLTKKTQLEDLNQDEIKKVFNVLKRRVKGDTDTIVKVAIINRKNKILVLKRNKLAAKYPNVWDLPGGHLKNGENLDQGAKREVEEETGLKVKDLNLLSKVGRLNFFKTKEYSGKILDDLPEHSTYRWITIADLKNYNFPSGGKSAIKLALNKK